VAAADLLMAIIVNGMALSAFDCSFGGKVPRKATRENTENAVDSPVNASGGLVWRVPVVNNPVRTRSYS